MDSVVAQEKRGEEEEEEEACVPRRTSAVLFMAPKNVNTPLEPVLLLPNETRKFVSGVKVGQLRGSMARKWKVREGTLNSADRALEEQEIRVTGLASQDDVVRRTLTIQQ